MCVCPHAGEGLGVGERESAADSQLSTELDSGLCPTTLKSQPEPKSRVEHLRD